MAAASRSDSIWRASPRAPARNSLSRSSRSASAPPSRAASSPSSAATRASSSLARPSASSPSLRAAASSARSGASCSSASVASAGARDLRGEPLDLLLQLALAQIGELAVDDVLEAGAQLEQLDLVDGDLALELARLLRDRPPSAACSPPLSPRAHALELALAIGELRLQPLDLDREVVHQRRILEHGLRDLAPVALALDAALELVDAPLLALHGIAQLHRGGGLLGQPFTAVRVLEVGDGALAFFQYLQALVELHLQLVEDAVALLLDALLDGLVLDAAQRSAQAPASAGLRGLL